MGCWNGTCVISNLPILAGEKVRFLMLTKNPYHCGNALGQESCYPTDFWVPRVVPIRAEYNDYGSIENFDSNSLTIKTWMDGFQQDLIEMPVGKNEYHDLATSKSMSFGEILDPLREGRILVEYKSIKKIKNLPICQVMIREDVYQAILTTQSTKKERKISIEKTLAKLTSRQKLFASSEGKYDKTIDCLLDIDCTSYDTISPTYASIYCIKNKLDINHTEVINLITDLEEFKIVSRFMVSCRTAWNPGCGAGSQQTNWNNYSKYHSKLLEIINTKNIAEQDINELDTAIIDTEGLNDEV